MVALSTSFDKYDRMFDMVMGSSLVSLDVSMDFRLGTVDGVTKEDESWGVIGLGRALMARDGIVECLCEDGRTVIGDDPRVIKVVGANVVNGVVSMRGSVFRSSDGEIVVGRDGPASILSRQILRSYNTYEAGG